MSDLAQYIYPNVLLQTNILTLNKRISAPFDLTVKDFTECSHPRL